MVQPSITRLEEVITWKFALAEQMNVSRYGTFDRRYWKQFMPRGMIITPLHPPKAIPKPQYDHAEKHRTE